MNPQWFPRAEILLIKLVQPQKFLYYLKSPRLKDETLVAETWQMISEEMCRQGCNFTAQECEKKWSLLRIKYGRIRKRTLKEQAQTGEFCDPRQKWEIYDAISFLDHYITNRKRIYRDPSRTGDEGIMCSDDASPLPSDVWRDRSLSPDLMIDEPQSIPSDFGCRLSPSISISMVPQNLTTPGLSKDMSASSFCNLVTSSSRTTEIDETLATRSAHTKFETGSNSSNSTLANVSTLPKEEVSDEEVTHLLLSLVPEVRRIRREHQLDFKIDLFNLVKNYRNMQ